MYVSGLDKLFDLGRWEPGPDGRSRPADGGSGGADPGDAGRDPFPPVSPVEVAGVTVGLRRQARPGAPALLLLSSWPESSHAWRGQWATLAAHHDLMAVDLPGCGGHGGGHPRARRPSGQAQVLADMLAGTGARPVVVAPGLAVPTALALAQIYPGALRGLVLVNGPWGQPGSADGGLAALAGSATTRGAATLAGPLLAAMALRRGRRLEPLSVPALLTAAARSGRPRGLRAALDLVATWPSELPGVAARLGDVTVPALVVWGTEDRSWPVEAGSALAAALPQGTFRALPGAGHLAHHDAGHVFAALVDEWVSQAPATAAPARHGARTPGIGAGGGGRRYCPVAPGAGELPAAG